MLFNKMEMCPQWNNKEMFLQGVHSNTMCSFFSLKFPSMNYNGPINTVPGELLGLYHHISSQKLSFLWTLKFGLHFQNY
jgi:hypothetical protein